MATELEYTVHFQKGTRVGARSLRMVHVQAVSDSQAIAKAKVEFPDFRAQKYRIVRVDHFEGNQIVEDTFADTAWRYREKE
jgi:hypothetical protein